MKNIPNFGITYENRGLEFLVKYTNLNYDGKTRDEIKIEVFDALQPIEHCDDLIKLLSQYAAFLRDYPFPGGMSENSFREYIRRQCQNFVK